MAAEPLRSWPHDVEPRETSGRWTRLDSPSESLRDEFANSVRAGLTASPKELHCAWFYDEQGSRLFEEICELPEYYLTRAEDEIFRRHAPEIVAGFAPGSDLVELGSGSGSKTRLLIAELVRRHGRLRYVPIDISSSALEGSAERLLDEFPRLSMLGIRAEYAEGLERLQRVSQGSKFVLWLGSNVGNFHRDDAAEFLGRIRRHLSSDCRLVMGVDLRKDARTLELAYDDPAGVTARFNLNLLARIDRELGGHFDLAKFAHRARYDAQLGRIEMFLDSRVAQRVRIEALDLEVEFAAGEPIHTEDSYKYSLVEIEELAARADFELEAHWLDQAERFCEARLRPV